MRPSTSSYTEPRDVEFLCATGGGHKFPKDRKTKKLLIWLNYSARSYIASPSIGNTLWRVCSSRVPEVNRFGWNLGHSVHMVCRWPWQILGAIRAEATARERSDICFLWGNQRATSLTSGRPNFTKFAHKTWICVAMNLLGTNFWKSSRKGYFFQKGNFWAKIDQRLPTSDGYNSLMIWIDENSWPTGPSAECRLSVLTAGISSRSFPWPAGCAHGRDFPIRHQPSFTCLKN